MILLASLSAAVGCMAAVEALDMESPEPDAASEPSDAIPSARSGADPVAARDDGRWQPCAALVGDATGQVRTDLEALCRSTGHDGSCVGFACVRTEPREAFECLLEAGELERVIALADADVPAARAFAREALSRSDRWTEDRLRAALHDSARVGQCSGCICDVEELSEVALTELLGQPDRAAMQPILADWAAGDPPPFALTRALTERPTEGWIDDDRLRALLGDADGDELLRSAAAHALAQRGDDVGRDRLYAMTRHSLWWVRDLGVKGLDALDDADAWDRLAPLLHDDTGYVRISLMRLGARLRPDDAVAVLDADGMFGAEAMALLPTRLFAPRAAPAVCAARFGDDEHRSQVVAALEGLPRRARCRALQDAEDRCRQHEPPGSLAHAVAPSLAEACGIEAPPPEPSDAPPSSSCSRG